MEMGSLICLIMVGQHKVWAPGYLITMSRKETWWLWWCTWTRTYSLNSKLWYL